MQRSQSVIAADVVKQIVFPNTDQAQIAFDHIVALDPVLYNAFDVNEFADKVETMGAGYVLFSVGQNRGYVSTTSAIYDNNSPPCPTSGTESTTVAKGCKNQTGKNKADFTPTRDLVLDLAKALKAKGIRTIAYTPCGAPNRWTGVNLGDGQRPQWYYDFVKERTQAWGGNISGWWFDGCYDNCPSSDAPKKFWDSTTAVNNKLAISFNNGIGIPKSFRSRSGYDHYTPGEMNRLFRQSDFDGFSGGAIARADGKKIQWHGWTYVTHHDPFNPPGWGGWGQVDANLRFTKEQIRDNTKFIFAAWSRKMAVNPDASYARIVEHSYRAR